MKPTHVLTARTNEGRPEIRPVSGGAPLPVWEGNLLGEPLPPHQTELVCWSGWLTEEAEPAAGRFGLDPRVWGPQAWAALAEARGRAAESGIDLIVRPHARHVLSDAQRCLRFIEDGGRVLLEPAALLTEGMLPDAADHLERIFGALAEAPAGVWGWLLTGVEAAGGGELRACPLGRGALEAETLLETARRSWAGQAVAVLEEDLEGPLGLFQGGAGSLHLGPL